MLVHMVWELFYCKKQDDNKFHPIGYHSRRTTDAEAVYHSFQLETIAVINALRKYRPCFEEIKFVKVTDCNSLTQTLAKKTLNPRIARWALEMENYQYTIVHRH